MRIGYNTKDIMLDLTTAQARELIRKSGADLFRFPGGADAANRNSFVLSGGVSAPLDVKNVYGDLKNPWAYAADFAWLLPGDRSNVSVVMNLNRHLQTKDISWYGQNAHLVNDIGSIVPIYLAEMGNEPYNDKTITGLRTPRNLEQAASKYCTLVKTYMNYLPLLQNADVCAVCAAPEENNAFRAWNRVIRDTFGDTVSYVHHIYMRPDDANTGNVYAMLKDRIGTPMQRMHITEASWQYKSGIADDPAQVRLFHSSLEWSARQLGMRSLMWFRLGGSGRNKYDWFKV